MEVRDSSADGEDTMPDDWDERDDVVAARPLSGAERVCPGAISCRVARSGCGPISAGHRVESVPGFQFAQD